MYCTCVHIPTKKKYLNEFILTSKCVLCSFLLLYLSNTTYSGPVQTDMRLFHQQKTYTRYFYQPTQQQDQHFGTKDKQQEQEQRTFASLVNIYRLENEEINLIEIHIFYLGHLRSMKSSSRDTGVRYVKSHYLNYFLHLSYQYRHE